MGKFDDKIFGKKKFSGLLSEIYNNQKKREQQISFLIQQLKPLINDIGDATLLVPLIQSYLDLGVKNDEQLIKMATIIQRVVSSSSNGGGGSDGLGISDEEKEELLKAVEELNPKDVSDDEEE